MKSTKKYFQKEGKSIKPRIFASRCLSFEACRWNGDIMPDPFIEKLKTYVDFVTTCPEKEIGLGVPRDPIRIVKNGESFKLVQLNTEKDVTEKMENFADKFLNSLDNIDGFILKDRSPSCGPKDVEVYAGFDPRSPIDKTSGFFAKAVLEKFPDVAVETETRLSDFTIRKHFLAKVFTMARFRNKRFGKR